MPVLYGSPAPLDEFLRPFVRGLQWVLGAITTLAAWWFAPVWAWPIPALAILIAGESVLWLRGNQLFRLHLTPDEIRFFRGSSEPEITLNTSEIESFNLLYHPSGSQRHAVTCVLRTATNAVGFQLECEGAIEWEPQDIPVEMMVALFGGNPALLRGMIPRDAIIGQVIRDPKCEAIHWLRKHVRQFTGDTQAARVWRGLEPELDSLGFHAHPPDGLIRTDTQRWSSPDGQLTFEPKTCGLAARNIPGVEDPLPILVIQINATQTICFPAPALTGWCSRKLSLTQRSYHTHLAEGVALFWAYLRHADTIPSELSEALMDISNLLGPLPDAIQRHISHSQTKSHSEVAYDLH